MPYLVSITSQGQISIPASIRRALGFEHLKKAIIEVDGKKVILRPAADVLSFAGAIHYRAKKGKNIGQIMKEEKQAYSRAIAKKYRPK